MRVLRVNGGETAICRVTFVLQRSKFSGKLIPGQINLLEKANLTFKTAIDEILRSNMNGRSKEIDCLVLNNSWYG